ncbi:MAG TPA: ABC transporter substrate-binding protein [Solirubrobacteraceae bacterium]
MYLRLLGPVEARLDGQSIALGAPKQRAVLAMLALEVGRTVSADRIVEGLWGEQPPSSAPKMVQLYVSHLRRLLEGNGAQIVTRGRGYELRLTDGDVDAVQFERLLGQSRVREALALWHGAALADVADEPFAAAEIHRLGELRVRAAEIAIDADLAAGRHGELVGELEALIDAHPLRERLHAQRMLALYRDGRQGDALNAYREARAVLVEEIGVEPGAELQRLQEAILAQDPALEPASPPPAHAMPPARPPPRRAVPLLAIAALLLFAGVVAFGVSRVTRPDSLARIDENEVGLIDADSGRITAQYAVGHGPQAVAAGAGSVWVANRLDGTISRINPDHEVVAIDVGGEPSGLAFGAGSLWVADGQGRTVAQVDPDTNKVEGRIEVGNAAHAVAVGSGAVWVASAVDATVVRIDLDGGAPKRIPVDAQPSALAAGAGAIWVASEATARVIRLDPRSGTPLAPIRVGNGPSSVAVGAGAVWVANRRDGTVSRIDPTTEVTETVPVGREPSAVATDEGGVWVANAGDGTLMRIDRRSLRATKTIAIESSPAALAVVDGDVWTAAIAGTAAHHGGTLRVRISADAKYPFRFDLSYDTRVALLSGLVYDGLVGYRRAGGSAGGTLVPDLARDLPEAGPDGRTYLFRLRPNLRFSSGAPVTPADVRASLERQLQVPGGGSGYFPIRGAASCNARRCDLSKGIETDPVAMTVTFHLSRPDVDFLHKLTVASVVPAGSPAHTRPPPGTGPYTFTRFARWSVRLVRNPHFHVWSPDARPDGFPDEIAVRLGAPRAEVAAVEDGMADIALFYYGIGQVARLRTRYGARLHTDPNPGTWFAFMNVHTPPFDDVHVRRALNYAVDRGRVAELLGTRETHVPTCQLLPPGMQGYTPSCPFTANPNPAGTWNGPDVARARRLVAASGTRGMKVEFWGSHPRESLGRYFAALLRRLGYRSSVRTFDDMIQVFETSVNEPRRPPQIGLWGWGADSASPLSFLKPLVSCSAGGENLSHLCDPEIDAQMEQAAVARGPEASELWRHVEASLAAQAPTVPLVNENFVSLAAKRVGNYQHHPLSGPLLDQLWVR